MHHLSRAQMLALLAAAPLGACGRHGGVRVGSKNFTEELFLGELYAQALEGAGIGVQRKLDLGGSDIAMAALRRGDIDLYPEYTGTALLNILHQAPIADPHRAYDTVRAAYAERFGLVWLAPAPMNDSQALAATRATAARTGARTLSELSRVAPQLVLGAVPEFVERADGLPGLKRRYGGFAFKSVKLIDFGLKYKALERGDVDVVVAFTTEGQIVKDDLLVFTDDRGLFPAYNVAPVVRRPLLDAQPKLAATLDALAPRLTTSAVQRANLAIDVDKREPADVAREFLHA